MPLKFADATYMSDLRLSPLDPLLFGMQHTLTLAHFMAGRYDEALSWEEGALRERPNFLPSLRLVTAINALTGRVEEAQKIMTRVRQLDPALRISNIRDWLSASRPEDIARYAEGMRNAGLPE